jgi:hypothetical protein
MQDDFEFTVGHKVTENKHHEMHAIQLTDEPYNGIIFSFGEVTFPTDGEPDSDGNVTLKFDYDIHDDAGIEYNKEEFEKYLGDFLTELIIYGVKNNNIAYSGGVDE